MHTDTAKAELENILLLIYTEAYLVGSETCRGDRRCVSNLATIYHKNYSHDRFDFY